MDEDYSRLNSVNLVTMKVEEQNYDDLKKFERESTDMKYQLGFYGSIQGASPECSGVEVTPNISIEEKNLNTSLLGNQRRTRSRVKMELESSKMKEEGIQPESELLTVKMVEDVEIARDEKGMFQCIYCLKSFSKKQPLKNHLKIHKGEKDFACDRCSKSFIHKQQLENHFKTHTGEKNFNCSLCTKRFIHKQQLQNHMKTHTGQKDFECDECDKRFTLKQQLQNHMKTHLGIKNYICEHCEKKFTLKQQLQNHLKIHLGIKDFMCSECDKQFRMKQQLDRHVSVHRSEK